jgi:uncharacterized protein (TIGR02452 family)
MGFDYVKWLKDFQVASSKKEGFRELRADIFKDTVKFVRQGYNIGKDQISIDNECIKSEYFDKPDILSKQPSFNTKFSVINSDCLEAAQLLINSGFNPCVLNMASRQNPGGGVLTGAGAQEENLFRKSNLFMSLYQFTDYADQYGIKKDKNSWFFANSSG